MTISPHTQYLRSYQDGYHPSSQKVSDKLHSDVRKLRAAGLTPWAIAKRLHVRDYHVRWILDEHGERARNREAVRRARAKASGVRYSRRRSPFAACINRDETISDYLAALVRP